VDNKVDKMTASAFVFGFPNEPTTVINQRDVDALPA
jgi:hypothetical protein